MRILFMGTPEIAACCLSHLVREGREVIGVVCQPDKPKGRGNKLSAPPVKEIALSLGIPVFQPTTLKDESFLPTLRELLPDVVVVVAYGKILPTYFLEFPPYGCINLHVSLLPKYRGAAPMQRAIMAGETETGVSVMQMDEGMDTGAVLATECYPITCEDTYDTVSDKAAHIGASLLCTCLDSLADGTAVATPQPTEGVSYAPKIEKSECHVSFALPATRVCCILRALSPAPLGYARLPSGKMLKLARACVAEGEGTPGQVLSVSDRGEGEILVACGEGALRILEVVPEGKGRMSAAAFVRGRGIAVGDLLA